MQTVAAIEAVFRAERARVLATTIRNTNGDFDLAEEIVQDAFAAALDRWPVEGTPDEPRAWLTSVARNKAIDAIRRRVKLRAIVDAEKNVGTEGAEMGGAAVTDDRLRLIYTCCHPALAREAQVALTLRTLCGLTTDEIARAFLASPTTMAQRIVRAKSKIKDAGIPYEVPEASELPERTDAVMAVIYLVFNEGYAATAGDSWTRRDLSREAIRLAKILVELTAPSQAHAANPTRAAPSPYTANQPLAANQPFAASQSLAASYAANQAHATPQQRASHAEALGLLALMLLHDSRRDARSDDNGDLVLLEDQDRARWDAAQIADALPLVPLALTGSGAGPGAYALQAAIAALHAQAPRAADTDWPQIAALYAELVRRVPTAVVALNHAVAVAMFRGPDVGLAMIDELADDLAAFHLFHAARADLLRRLGRTDDAANAYRAALALVGSEPERRFLQRRLDNLAS